MPPQSRVQKRKRAPPGASRADDDDASNPARSQRAAKRRRPANDESDEHQDHVQQRADTADGPTRVKKKRGRPSLKDSSAADIENRPESSPAAGQPPKRKRGRPSLAEVSVRNALNRSPEQSASTSGQPKRKRGRPSLAEVSVRNALNRSPEQSASTSGQPKRKRGRPSLAEVSVHNALNRSPEQSASTSGQPKRKPGRPSLASQPDDANSPRGRGRPRKSGAKAARKPGRPSGSAMPSRDPQQQDDDEQDEEARPRARQRRRELRPSLDAGDEEQYDAEDDTLQFDAKYPYLQARNQLVPPSTMTAKWSLLDAASIDAVDAILREAERPILSRLPDGRRRHEFAASALSVMSRLVHKRLMKGLLFPPPTIQYRAGGGGGASRSSAANGGSRGSGGSRSHAEDLTYERVVDVAQEVENKLTPVLHSIDLLKKEIAKQEKLLEADYADLRELERNAQAEKRAWRKRARSAHVLAPEMKKGPLSSAADDDGTVSEGGGDEEAGRRSLELVVPERHAVGLFKGIDDDGDDDDLVNLSQQISSHMESMKGNLQQVDGILPAITKSKAALQEVLLKHLDPAQSDRILLG